MEPGCYEKAAANPLVTRADLGRLLVDLAEPLAGRFSPGRAQVRIGATRGHFGDPAGWLEGFARPLWGLVPYLAGGGEPPGWNQWLEGIAHGTDPAHPEYWGVPGDYDQRSVESAAFGFALLLAPEKVWEPLTPAVQARLVAWLDRINHVRIVESNWLFFRRLVNRGLARVGARMPDPHAAADWALIESFHRGNGWYCDGVGKNHHRDGRVGDYYIPMAFHFYGLLLASLPGEPDPAHVRHTRQRAEDFAQDFQYWFAADGSALPFGRSLAYRFSQGAFWGALAFANLEALPWGEIKGLYLRHLRWWMRQPIFHDGGFLSVGYAYPNHLVAESYNSAQSPYWAFKAFLPLALPESHPFWRATELPVGPRRKVHSVPGANLILQTSPGAAEVVALNPGQPVADWPRNASHKYSKCAYSTRFGFAVPASTPTPTEGGLDGVIALSDDNKWFRGREQCFDAQIHDGVAHSVWRPWGDVEVASWILAESSGHIRIYRVRSGRRLWAMDSGFSVPYTDKATRVLAASPHVSIVRAPQGASSIRPVYGEFETDAVDLGAGSHLLASLSAMPLLKVALPTDESWLASWVQTHANPEWAFDDAPELAVSIRPAGAMLTRSGVPWWTSFGAPCGVSAETRLAELEGRQ